MMFLGAVEGFYWVVRCEGYTAAARQFPYPITQPGVYRQVRELEASLGMRLVTAVGKRRVVPTPEGRRLYSLVAPLIESLASFKTGVVELRIAASSLLLRYMLPRALHGLSQRVALTQLERPDASPLLEGDADILLDYFADEPAGCTRRLIGHLDTFLVYPPGTRAPRRGQRVEAVVYSPGTPAAALQKEAFATLGLVVNTRISAPTADHVLALVAAGHGVSLLALPEPPPLVSSLRIAGARLPIHALFRARDRACAHVVAQLRLRPARAPKR